MTDQRFDPAAVRYGADGLVPAIVQDEADGRVLMLGWVDDDALRATLRTREVWFHSRSRGRLWRKGETSGNVLRLVSVALDCDADALLVRARPAGPTCHRGTGSCFDPMDDGSARGGDPDPIDQGFAGLEALWRTIASRAAERPEGSYTARLLDGGVDRVSRKVAEEATEVVLAAKDDAAAEAAGTDRAGTRAALAGELADLVYHALALVAERNLEPHDVIDVLAARSRGDG